MAQKNIDFGTFPDDPDADAIRTAFQKTQENFTELFAGLDQQGVLSVNKTPGDGISAFPITGNVVVSANIACVTIQTSTLAVGVGGNTGNGIAIMTQSANQQLYIDLPANITGITGANFSGTVIANVVNANSSINSSGTLGVTGNIAGGNITSNGIATITGNVLAGNVYANSGTIGASLVAGTLKTNAQPNITSVGTLTSLAVTGNITSGNANLGNLASANFFQGDGYLLTNVSAAPGNSIINGSSNVRIISPNGDVFISVAGTSNVVQVTQTGANVTGYLTTSSNLTAANANLGNAASANFFIGSGNNLSNIQGANVTGAVATANVVVDNAQPNITSVGTLTSLTVTNKVTAGQLQGDGGNISNIQGANVSGTVANATYATSAGTAGSATTAGTVTTNAQSNITSVGTLTGLNVNGNITAANITANTGVFTGNGSGLTNLAGANVTGTVANATYALDAGNATNATSATSATTAGTVTTNAQPNITSVGTLTSVAVTGNTTAGNVYANSGTIGASSLTGTLTTNAQPNITSVGTLTGLGVNGNIVAANVTANTGVFTGNAAGLTNIPGANVTGAVSSATTAGTVTTNAQPNITSVGTLSSLAVTGNVSAGNANLGNLAIANFFSGDGSLLTNISVGAGSYIENGNSEVRVDANSNVRVSVAGNANVVTVTGTGANIAGTANVSGNLSAGNVSATLLTGTLATSSQPNITSLGTLTGLNVAGISNLGPNSNVIITGGSNNQFLLSDGSGGVKWITPANTTVAPGSNTQVLFNDASSLGANANLTFNKTTGTLTSQALSVTNSGTFGNVYANSGTVGASLLTGTLTTSSQPNVTSLGTLTSLIVGGNVNAGNVSGGNAVSANYFNGNHMVLAAGTHTSQLAIANLTQSWNNASVSFTAAIMNITDTNSAAGSKLLDLQVGGVSKFSVDKAGVVSGNGSSLFSIAGANVTGTVANATYATSAGSATTATSATTAGTVTTNAQPNITSVGTLTSLIVSGNLNAGNVSGGNLVTANFVTSTLTTNAQPNITSVGTLTSLSVTGKVTAGQLQGDGGNISNIQGANVSGAVASATTAATVTTAAQPNITSVGTLTTLGVSGNITAANITANTGVFTGNGAGLTNIAGANVTGSVSSATTAGTVTTNAQPNITSTGTLTSLTVSGNIAAQANVNMTGYVIRSVNAAVSAAGTVQGNATAITKEMNVVSTVASGAGVVLPTAVAGMVISITNTSANSLEVYPATSAAINSGAANAAYTQPAGSTLQFIAPTTTQWYTVGATFA
jgi:hypothetical protein